MYGGLWPLVVIKTLLTPESDKSIINQYAQCHVMEL